MGSLPFPKSAQEKYAYYQNRAGKIVQNLGGPQGCHNRDFGSPIKFFGCPDYFAKTNNKSSKRVEPTYNWGSISVILNLLENFKGFVYTHEQE